MMNDDDDFRARERLHQYFKIFGSILSILVLTMVLFIFYKQAQIMNDVSETMRQTMETMGESIDNAESDYSNDYPSDY